jgi:hypothetical protein
MHKLVETVIGGDDERPPTPPKPEELPQMDDDMRSEQLEEVVSP